MRARPPAPAVVRTVFLDKDGTLIENVPYNVDPALIRLAPGAASGIARLAEAGYRFVVVSNQSGVARGLFPEEALEEVRDRIEDLLAPLGAGLDGFYYCPHLPGEGIEPYARACECRKPADGLVRRAAANIGVNAADGWLVGDILDDIEAGRRAGCRTVLIDRGGETEWRMSPLRTPHYRAPDLAVAAALITAADEALGDLEGSDGARPSLARLAEEAWR